MNGLDLWPLWLSLAAAGGWLWIAHMRPEVGAWSGLEAWTHVDATIALAKARGVDRLCLFVNQEPGPGEAFNTYHRATLIAAAQRFRRAGFKLTIVSWMTPRPDWIAGAVELGQLASDCGADELEFDLEEDWTAQRDDPSAAVEARTAALLANARQRFRGRVGGTFIVYTDLGVLGFFLKRADFGVPQAYATQKNAGKLPPGRLEAAAVERFRDFRVPLIMGVAGWNQAGAGGKANYLDALRDSLDAVKRLGVRRVRVWRLELIDQHEGRELAAWKGQGVA